MPGDPHCGSKLWKTPDREIGSHFGITFGRRSKTIEGYESITSYYLQCWQIDWKAAKSIRDLGDRKSPLTTPP
jgi:hypothetical protein